MMLSYICNSLREYNNVFDVNQIISWFALLVKGMSEELDILVHIGFFCTINLSN